MSERLSKYLLFCTGIALILFNATQLCAAATLKFDLAKCPSADGKLYIALGNTVLAVDDVGTMVLDPVPLKQRLVPPDPTQSVGCRGNPEQTFSYSFAFYIDVGGHDGQAGLQSMRSRMELLQLIVIRGANKTSWSGEIPPSPSFCEKATIREELPNGLIACRRKPDNDDSDPVEDWVAQYVAKPEIYTTPLGRPFAVHCVAGIFTSPIGDCYVGYILQPGLGVTYRFKPYQGASIIPISRVIDVDRELRDAIRHVIVKDYEWPSVR